MLRGVVYVVVFYFILIRGQTASHLLSSGPHLADVNILLPPKMTHPVEYRLQGSDGCFKWSWDHHDILAVMPEYNSSSHCSTSARLRSVAPYSGRKETAVYATDVNTGVVIRCKVFIDNISRIRIVHNAVKLDLDGLATLRVHAFDDEDNIFSSLVGVQFLWQLLLETDGSSHHLVNVPLKDSPVSDCGGLCGDLNIRVKLEESGVFSDWFMVQGTGIGQENVSVHLLEPRFEHMDDMIVLTVAEAMSVEPPSPLFVLVGATLQYSLKVIRGSHPQVVALPSAHHRWSVTNSSVAEVDSRMGLMHALSLGETGVVVEDTRVAGNIQASSVNVVLPDSLCLYMTPLSVSGDPLGGVDAISSAAHWFAVSGRQYLVQFKVFWHGPEAKEIYVTESDDLQLYDESSAFWKIVLPSDDMMVKHGWRNSRILIATSQGVGRLTASLTYFCGQEEMKKILEVVQEVSVCDPVKISLEETIMSETILLPWAPAIYQEVELKATGGCGRTAGDYRWFASDMSTLLITASGVVQARKPGKATVKVVSNFDPLNYDEVVIEVSVPSSMMMLQNFPVETVVGMHLQAAVTMKASNDAYFYKCDAFHPFIKWMTGSESFVVVNTTEKPHVYEKLGNESLLVYGPSCSWTRVYTSGDGQTILQATLSKDYHHVDRSLTVPVVLKASMFIAAYPPLTVHQVSDGNQFGGYWFDLAHLKASNQSKNLEKLYLAPGTTLDVILLGGPQPWGKRVDFTEYVEILADEHAPIEDGGIVKPVFDGHGNFYRVLCSTMGTFNLVFKRGNLVGDDHPLPAIAEATLSIACRFPSSIALIVDEPVNKQEVIGMATLAGYSAGHIRATPVTVANGQTIRIAAVGVDFSGEAFANSSSLSLKWELTGCERLASWDDAFESKVHKSSWERFLALKNESGECVVRATVTELEETKDDRYFGQIQISEKILTDAIRIQIVSSLRINPEFTLLFCDPNAKANLSITGGSCFLETVVNDSQVVEVIRPPPSLQCLQLTVSPKGVGIALVTVYDIGLTPPSAASAMVQVADVEWIKIVSADEISLMEGQSKSIDLAAGTKDGSTFDSYQYAYMKIRLHLEEDLVDLEDNDDILSPDAGYLCVPHFKIVGKHLGITTLYVTARQHSGHEIMSQKIMVEVYAPLRIHPSEIFLVPGASYMLTVEGGPTIGASVDFTSADVEIATVDGATGKLSALSPGNTTILSRVYVNGGIMISEASGMVKVGVPAFAKLDVQSEQLDVGCKMPIHPMFSEGNLFSFYKLCKRYQWTIKDEKVMLFIKAEGLHGEKQGTTLDAEKELGLFKILHGRSAGRTTVAVTFSCDFISLSYSQSRLYNASLSLLVVPHLPLALGAPITWVLPPHYTTSSILPSSLELHSERDGKIQKGTVLYSLLRGCEKNEGWQQDAISIDGDSIKTSESGALACIQAQDKSTGKIAVASCIRTAEVAQIRIGKGFPHHMAYVAVGALVDLPINFFDALGNPFYEAHNIIQYDAETNFPDIVAVACTRNGSDIIHLKGKRHGEALVRLSMNSNPEKSYYMLISVGAHLYPQNSVLRQGSSINFVVEGIGMNEQASGHWHSSNESIISIHTVSGKADAVGVGSTQVLFESPNMQLRTSITVLPGSILSVVAPKEILTNVLFPEEGYSFSVKISDTYGKFEDVPEDKEVLFDCKVDPDFVGYAKPWRDIATGLFYCRFVPYSPQHLLHSLPKSKDMRPYVPLYITASLRDANHISGSASSLFIGGFSVVETDKSVKQLNLTSDSNKTVITILGNTDVMIEWRERDLLRVRPINRQDFGIGGRVEYEVKVLEDKRFSDKIIILLPASGQRVELDVNYHPGPRATPKIYLHDPFWSIVSFFSAMLVFAIFFLMVIFELINRFRQSVSPATPTPITTPVTPERRNAHSETEQSPRTPQPFIDYVRQTIDETPYYRREARRRFNPQNTY